MHIEELDYLRVACYLNRHDMKEYGISRDDLINRTSLAHMFFQTAGRLAKQSTDYAWPGCAMSLEMKFKEEVIIVIFSERIDDYIYNLKQTAAALPAEQAISIDALIDKLKELKEEDARVLIKNFERNIREVNY